MKIPPFKDEAIVSDIIDLKLPNTVYIIREMWGDQEFTKNQLLATVYLMEQYGVNHVLSEAVFQDRESTDLFGALDNDKAAQMALASQIKPVEYLAVSMEKYFNILAGDDNYLYDKQNAALKASMELSRDVNRLVDYITKHLLDALQGKTSEVIMGFINAQLNNNHYLQTISQQFNSIRSYCAEKNIELPAQLKNIEQSVINEQAYNSNKSAINHELKHLLGRLISALDNEDPEEKVVENMLTFGLSKIVYGDSNYKIENILKEGDEAIYQFYLNTAKFFKELLLKSESQIETNPALFARLLVDITELLCLDYDMDKVASFLRNATLSKNLKESFVDKLDYIKQFQKQLIVQELDNYNQAAAFQFLLDLQTINLLIKNQLSAIDQKKSQKLLDFESSQVLDRLLEFDIHSSIITEFESNVDIWDMALERTKRFYFYSNKRQEVMVNCLKNQITKNADVKNYLFNMGGFHSDYVQRELSRLNIANSMCITPQKSNANQTQVESAYYKLFK